MSEKDPTATYCKQTKPQPELTVAYVKGEDRMVDMKHRVFGLRRPVDMPALGQAICELKDQAPAIVYADMLPISLTTLNVVISAALPRSWIEDSYEDPCDPDNKIVLFSLVEQSLRRVVQNSSIDPRDIITS